MSEFNASIPESTSVFSVKIHAPLNSHSRVYTYHPLLLWLYNVVFLIRCSFQREKHLVNVATTVTLCIPSQAACITELFSLFLWAAHKQKWSCWQEFRYSQRKDAQQGCNKNNDTKQEGENGWILWALYIYSLGWGQPAQSKSVDTGSKQVNGQYAVKHMKRGKQSSAFRWLLPLLVKHSFCVGLSGGLSSPDRFHS